MWDSPPQGRMECAADSTSGLVFLLTFLETFRVPRGDGQAEAGGIAFHHIYNSCWVPSAVSKHCFTSPSARDHKEHLMKCPYLYPKEKRKIPSGEKKRRPNVRMMDFLRNIIQDVLLFVEKIAIDHSGTDYACRIR